MFFSFLWSAGWRLALISLLSLVIWIWPASATSAQPSSIQPSSIQPNSIQPYIDRVAEQISEFTLSNGMKFIVMERHQAPTVSFMTYVDVGSAYEQANKTGAAHFLEHLAFKGTTRIGTQNYQAEQPLLSELDSLAEQIKASQTAGKAVELLQQQFEQTQAKAAAYVNQNEFGQIVQQAGGVGLNATTTADATRYFYSFPANKLELWMSLESERFLDPVFREFYQEQAVILEERRMRTDNSPIGKLVEEFLQVALPDHPYGRPVIGYEADIRNLESRDVRDLFERYYTPDRIIIGIVGDVDPKQVQQMAEAYFGRFQAQSRAPDIAVNLPPQTAPRSVSVTMPSQPWYMEGYQRPGLTDPDDATYQMISSILSGGRTARLYRSLVEQQQLALSVQVTPTFPGDRYSNLLLLFAQTAPNHSIEEVAAAVEVELTRLKTTPVPAAELDQVKTQARAGLLQTLASNQGMASLLPEYEAKTGSWHNLFEELKAIDAVTAADVQRVAQRLFQPQNQTVGKLTGS
ncbi:MAG: insulinase family protein [Pegethrix bostrychoides GSE-TBD4-15B]|jgi:predicted Zn-dependent peptidase|uniref:Insulinase family protein n=1 Tax=Pegethrix bostrychoides GSE-TBD4-15B TaxID=2839662 RepID=A0A951U423_9CYAN|nr:insulinase family protein [Pegethrix bostrychoides GSE-TBD4-15B]